MIEGMITIYKEPGYTSSDVVAKMRGILHMKKIGHTGTLDPQAEGVLPVCLGNGTKLADLIGDRDKEYEAVLRLGVTTDTQDMTGTVTKTADPAQVEQITKEQIEAAAAQFRGTIQQIPPMYSAVWQNGKRLYQLAREGRVVERKPRTITISSLVIGKIDLPLVTMRVTCSKGTYIRTLCEDFGNVLGVGGTMEHLLRTRVGKFTLERALKLSELEDLAKNHPEELRDYVYPIDFFFGDAPAVYVNEASFPYLNNGNPLSFQNVIPEKSAPRETILDNEKKNPGSWIRVYDMNGEFYGIYHYDAGRRRMICGRMFHRVAGDTRPVRS